ncbi:MAG: MFS transporter [Solirubrobacteraceae bacterium]
MTRSHEQRPSATRAIRPLWTQVYLPNLVIATGQGAMLPILVYAARDVHASPAMATAIVAINGFGTMVFDLPAGRIVARFGEWRSGWIATCTAIVGLVGCLLARSVPVLAASIFVQAAGWAVWSLVRITHLSRVAPAFARGRALSLFGGVVRTGNVLGPFLFVAVSRHDETAPAFMIYLGCVVAGFAWTLASRDRADHAGATERSEPVHPLRVLRSHRRGFATAGVGALGISLLRGSRVAMVPLWAAHVGLGSSTAATIFALSSLVELGFFYPAGVISDRWGRRAVALPCILLLSIGHLLLPLSDGFTSLLAVALVLGFGNAFGSGIVMTLGADLTPAVGRASFLAVWRTISDGGTVAGPLVDAAVVGLASITLVGPVVGVVGLTCAALVARWMEEPGHLTAALAEAGKLPDTTHDSAKGAEMGFGDRFKGIAQQAKGKAADNREKIQGAVDAASAAANQKTHGKYADRLMKVSQKTGSALDKLADGAEADTGATSGPESGTAARPDEPQSSSPTGEPPRFDE